MKNVAKSLSETQVNYDYASNYNPEKWNYCEKTELMKKLEEFISKMNKKI